MVGRFVLRGGPGHEGVGEWILYDMINVCVKEDNLKGLKHCIKQGKEFLPVPKGPEKPAWESFYRYARGGRLPCSRCCLLTLRLMLTEHDACLTWVGASGSEARLLLVCGVTRCRTPPRLGMSLLHMAIDASALNIFNWLVKVKNMDVTASTTGPSIRGKVAATPPLHLAVFAAARHGCDPKHASWSILDTLVKDTR